MTGLCYSARNYLFTGGRDGKELQYNNYNIMQNVCC